MARVPSRLALGALVLAGCGAGAHASPPGSTYNRLVDAFRVYASCARTHGLPNLPDPQVDERGNDHYPLLAAGRKWPASVLRGCAREWDRVHAIRDQLDSEREANRPANPAELRKAIAFARCVRLHGFPSFPDPDSGGHFVATTPGFDKLTPSPQARAASYACRQP